MAETRVVGIISYKINTAKNLKLERQIFFPQIHPIIKEANPNWLVYRADAKMQKKLLEMKPFQPSSQVIDNLCLASL